MTPADIVPAIPVPCAYLTEDGRVAEINAEMSGLFGEAIRGRHYITAFRQPEVIDKIEAALANGSRKEGRYFGRQAGRDTIYAVTATPLGEIGGCLVFFEDMTHLEEAGERRTEFVANVSHELRTPLTAIAGFIETLRGPARGDAEARERFLEIMERETRRMNRLVDELLSLARVEDVERVRPQQTIDLDEILSAVVRAMMPQAERRQVALRYTAAPELAHAPAHVPGDPDQLTQVFTNLIENAIKYGGGGGEVTVTLDRLDNAQLLRGPGLRIRVADNGEGIDERHLGRLTERFYRVDSHRSRGMGGTGLGLAIVKHIVNRHRGRLRIESTPGEGSTFCVFLPSQ